MNIVDTLSKQYQKTQGFITSMVCAAGGWRASNANQPALSEDLVYTYAWDSEHDWGWMCSMSLAGYRKLQAEVHANPERWDALRGMAATCVMRAAAGDHGSAEPDSAQGMPEWERELAMSLMAYVATSSLAREADTIQANAHLIVLRIPKGDQGSQLQAVALDGEDKGPFTTAQLRDVVAEVLDMVDPKGRPGDVA